MENRFIPILQAEYERRRAKNPAYSLRAFAKQIDFSPSHLSELFAGKRNLSIKAARKLIAALDIPIQEAKKLTQDSLATVLFRELNSSEIRMLSDWYYFGLHALAMTHGFRADPKWVSERLGITRRDARRAIRTLVECGLLEEREDGRIVASTKDFTTTHDVSDTYIRRGHRQSLELAQASMDEFSVEERDLSTITMATDPARMLEAKDRIKKFRRELCEFLEAAPPAKKTEVFQLNIQLFPLTKRGSRK